MARRWLCFVLSCSLTVACTLGGEGAPRVVRHAGSPPTSVEAEPPAAQAHPSVAAPVMASLPSEGRWRSEPSDTEASDRTDAASRDAVAVRHGPCPPDVAALPESPLYSRDDRRLLRDALIVVHKSARRLMVYSDGTLRHCFPAGLGFSPSGHKQVEGDGRTPEGWYRTSDKPWSTFAGAIAIHYPNADDAEAAYREGRIGKRVRDDVRRAWTEGRLPHQRTSLGGAILIHAGGAGSDWTLGCVALEEADLEVLRGVLPPGQRTDILILP